MSARIPWVTVERGKLSVDDSGLHLQDLEGFTAVQVGRFAALLLEPGVTVTHESVRLCAEFKTKLIWTGEGATKFYATASVHGTGQGVIQQVLVATTPVARVKAASRL